MKVHDSASIISTTFNSINEGFSNLQSRKVTNQQTIELLKFVYYERKSIKQAANHLRINYNTAKRILKKFRNRKDVLNEEKKDGNNSPFSSTKLIKSLRSSSTTVSHTLKGSNHNEGLEELEDINSLAALMGELRQVGSQLINLNQEIKQNQQTLIFLANSTKGIAGYINPFC